MRLRIFGDEVALKMLKGCEDRARDLRPAWEKIVLDMAQMEEEVFSTEGASIGEDWPALSTKYAAWKSKRTMGLGLRGKLVLSGELRESLTNPDHPNFYFDSQPTAMEFGTNLKVGDWFLGALHQEGTKRMPARRLMPTSAEQARGHVNTWKKIIEEHLGGNA